jgi:hypothetical protein
MSSITINKYKSAVKLENLFDNTPLVSDSKNIKAQSRDKIEKIRLRILERMSDDSSQPEPN